MLILTHIILAIILFLLVNFIGKHSITAGYIQLSLFVKTDEAPAFNFLYRSLTPVVFIVLVAAVVKAFGLISINYNIYLVVIYYHIIRLAFNFLAGRRMLLNWGVQFMYLLVSIPISIYIYNNLIINNEFLLPTKQDLATAVWLSIIAFLYKTFNNIKQSNERTIKRKENFIRIQYEKYSHKYATILNKYTGDKRVEALIYSVMIYEDFNRPKLYRIIEYITFYFGISKTLGIMQYKTDKIITDKESVELGAQKIVDLYYEESLKMKTYINHFTIRSRVTSNYNKDDSYVAEIEGLFFIISKLYYKDTVTEYYTLDEFEINDEYLKNIKLKA